MSAASEREGLRLAVQEGLIAAWDDATEYADAPRVVADAVFAALSGLGYVRIDPEDEALVEKVLDAFAEDGLLCSCAHDNPRDVLVEANAQIVARAALKAVTR